MSRKNPNILPPLSKEKQEHRDYARPRNVVGRMKPVKGRKMLRRWLRESDPQQEERSYSELEKLIP